MGGHNNTAAIIVALSAVLGRRGLDAHRLSPWYFPSAEAYGEKLEAAGFTIDDIRIVPRPTPLPAGLEAWLDTFADDFFGSLAAADAARRLRARSSSCCGRCWSMNAAPGSPIMSACGFRAFRPV